MADMDSEFKVEKGFVVSGIQSFPIEDISRISWGAIDTKLNGVNVGTKYVIYFGDNEKLATVSVGTSDYFDTVTSQLWEAVAYPLAVRIAHALKGGQALNFGGIVVSDAKVSLSKPSGVPFVGKPTIRSYGWGQIDMQSQNGRLWLYPINDEKGPSGSSSYIENYNTAVLAHLIRIAKSKNLNTISDVFTAQEYATFESQAKSTQAYTQLPGDKPNKLSIGQMIATCIIVLVVLYFTLPK